MIKKIKFEFHTYCMDDQTTRQIPRLKEQVIEVKGTILTLLSEVVNRTHEYTIEQIKQKEAEVMLSELYKALEAIDEVLFTPSVDDFTLFVACKNFNKKLPETISFLDENRELLGKELISMGKIRIKPLTVLADENGVLDVNDLADKTEVNKGTISEHIDLIASKEYGDNDIVTYVCQHKAIKALEEISTINSVLNELASNNGSPFAINGMVELFNDKVGDILDLLYENPRLWHD